MLKNGTKSMIAKKTPNLKVFSANPKEQHCDFDLASGHPSEGRTIFSQPPWRPISPETKRLENGFPMTSR